VDTDRKTASNTAALPAEAKPDVFGVGAEKGGDESLEKAIFKYSLLLQ